MNIKDYFDKQFNKEENLNSIMEKLIKKNTKHSKEFTF